MTESDAIEGEAATSDDLFWIELIDDSIKNMPARYDEPAKQLITISGVLQGLYFVAISFSSLKDQISLNCAWDYLLNSVFLFPIIFWLGSLYFAIRVLMPKFRPEMSRRSISEAKRRWQDDRDSKSQNLTRAQWLLVLGFIPLILSICCYLIFFHGGSSGISISIK